MKRLFVFFLLYYVLCNSDEADLEEKHKIDKSESGENEMVANKLLKEYRPTSKITPEINSGIAKQVQKLLTRQNVNDKISSNKLGVGNQNIARNGPIRETTFLSPVNNFSKPDNDIIYPHNLDNGQTSHKESSFLVPNHFRPPTNQIDSIQNGDIHKPLMQSPLMPYQPSKTPSNQQNGGHFYPVPAITSLGYVFSTKETATYHPYPIPSYATSSKLPMGSFFTTSTLATNTKRPAPEDGKSPNDNNTGDNGLNQSNINENENSLDQTSENPKKSEQLSQKSKSTNLHMNEYGRCFTILLTTTMLYIGKGGG